MSKLLTLSQISLGDRFSNIRLVATDMDGTLTVACKFTSQLLQAFENLAMTGIKVLIVTASYFRGCR
ncbi:hypothetical protein [Fischerella thermalis]|jgi:hydroxymethylpyrimidine pyrophosphatase-like HAD family hydrolase|uniref:hypothetical protein n=1 Tax=Fischerella thermalis TaxID=372787 RepID=UPI002155A10C|nr:hypothetical protein [Fischerella thermalis]